MLASGKRAPRGPVAAVETKYIRSVDLGMTYRLQRQHRVLTRGGGGGGGGGRDKVGSLAVQRALPSPRLSPSGTKSVPSRSK